MTKTKKGANAVGHNSVFSAVTTALVDLISKKNQLKPLSDDARIDGKVCFVTGANSGLGKAVAIQLAKRGGHVIMACRSGIPEAGEDVKRLSGSDNVEMMKVDLSDLNFVNALCDTLRDRNITIDIAVMNAGLMPLNARRSEQEFELMFAVHFLSNRVMMDRWVNDGILKKPLKDAVTSRVIFVSSEAHQSSDPIDFAHFGEFVDYGLKDGLKHYGMSKLHLSTFANELSKRLNADCKNASGVNYAIHSLCPGPVASNIAKESPTFLKPILKPIMSMLFSLPEKAAAPIMLLACSEEMGQRSGVYLHMMKEKELAEEATKAECGEQLWEASQTLIGDYLSNQSATPANNKEKAEAL